MESNWIAVEKNGKLVEPTFTKPNIQRAAQGVAEYYKQANLSGAMLLGFDPRGNNAEWAKEIASIMVGNGIPD